VTAAYEAATILASTKARKVQYHSFQNKCRETNNSKFPFTVEGLEGFGTFFTTGDFWGHFWGGARMIASASEADEPKSNKSSARAKVFLPAIFTFAEEVFSLILSLEDCATNFLLGFTGLAKASSCAEV
jgi:hypothetical protein